MVLGPFTETKEPVLSVAERSRRKQREGTSSRGGDTPHEKSKDTGFPIEVGNDSRRQEGLHYENGVPDFKAGLAPATLTDPTLHVRFHRCCMFLRKHFRVGLWRSWERA